MPPSDDLLRVLLYVGAGYAFAAFLVGAAVITQGASALSKRLSGKKLAVRAIPTLNGIFCLGSTFVLAWMFGRAFPLGFSELGGLFALLVWLVTTVGGMAILNALGLFAKERE